jgi:hypothetical protein
MQIPVGLRVCQLGPTKCVRHGAESRSSDALAGLTLEQLGCAMWTDDANGQYTPTGGYEWGTTYTTQKQGLGQPDQS